MEGQEEGDGEEQPQTKKEFNNWRSQFKNTVHACVVLYDDRPGVPSNKVSISERSAYLQMDFYHLILVTGL